jgi:hypothetical protein
MTPTIEFDCKLAHYDEIKKLSGFNSIKELYVKINQAFKVETKDILYCTLNTHNFRDMSAILGNYLSFGDLIVVHLCGKARDITIKKTHEFLGLTITDNSIGRAFVKRVKSDDKSVEDNIKPGDHIAAINSDSMIGLRHYEVAKAIRLLPQNTNFTIRLVEPNHVDKYVMSDRDMNWAKDHGLKGKRTASGFRLSDGVSLASACDDLVNPSLPIDKLLSKSMQSTEHGLQSDSNNEDNYKVTIDKMNGILESFLGISDNLLAIKIYRLAKENENSFKEFAGAIAGSDLEVFNFDDEMKDYLWKCATEMKVR